MVTASGGVDPGRPPSSAVVPSILAARSSAQSPEPSGTRDSAGWLSTPASLATSWAATLSTSAGTPWYGRGPGCSSPSHSPADAVCPTTAIDSSNVSTACCGRGLRPDCGDVPLAVALAETLAMAAPLALAVALFVASRRHCAALLRRSPAAKAGATEATYAVSSSVNPPSAPPRHRSSQPQQPCLSAKTVDKMSVTPKRHSSRSHSGLRAGSPPVAAKRLTAGRDWPMRAVQRPCGVRYLSRIRAGNSSGHGILAIGEMPVADSGSASGHAKALNGTILPSSSSA